MWVISAKDAMLQRNGQVAQSTFQDTQMKTAGLARGFRWLPHAEDQAAFFSAFLSKNCSSSVEPLSAAVDDSFSMVVVTASK